MARPKADQVTCAAVIGTGLIGGAWAALFLSRGIAVRASDPSPQGEAHLHKIIDRAWPVLERLGLAPDADRARVRFFKDQREALDGAQFVQENAPEKLNLKIELLAEIDAVLPPDIVLSSSTSGFLPSRLQSKCTHPARVVVGHPFNPPYLVPLVEVAGGEKTEQWAIDWAADFYAHVGKRPLKLKREIAGFVANRLQAAIFREMIHLTKLDIASIADIDAAIAHGPGLRWAIMGPALTFHLARQTGIEDFIHLFAGEFNTYGLASGDTVVDADTYRRMVEGTHDEAAGRSLDALSKTRDESLIGIRRLLAGMDLPD
ncbi:MAG: 3-hydroxyacyl-CoA dehydrogenase NAD-binding domain-containing protein [Alphaproteobacteria bacterium]